MAVIRLIGKPNGWDWMKSMALDLYHSKEYIIENLDDDETIEECYEDFGQECEMKNVCNPEIIERIYLQDC